MKKLFFLLIAFACYYVNAQSPWTQIVSQNKTLPDSLLRNLRIEHPRLLATQSEFATLKSHIQADTTLKAWYNNVIKDGERLLAEPVSVYKIPDGLRLLNVSRQVVDRIYTLALLYQVQGDKKWGQRAWQELEAVSKFQDWNPKHFLDVAEMTNAFAIGYDWLYHFFTVDQRNVIKSAIIEKGLNRALLAYSGLATQNESWWVKVEHNWNQVCNGGIGLGALAIADEEPKLAEHILRNIITALPYAMEGFAPDGAWNEGPGYWSYTTRYNTAILAGLQTALGTDFGLSKIEGFSRTGLFPVYTNGPFNKSFNYADAGDGPAGGAQLFWFANKFNQPLAAQYQKALIKDAKAMDIVWYSSELINKRSEPMPLAAYFKAAEVVTMRSAWNDKNAFFVGFKAGDNKANHSNLDLGSFVLDALGKRWALDLGAENYNLPGYFSTGANGTRWTYYRMRAEGHNTIVLNPGKNADQDPLAETKMTAFAQKGNTAFAIAELTPAYATNATSVRRGIALVNGNSIVIQDEVKAKEATPLYWFMHTPAKITISANGKKAMLTIEDKQLEATLVAPAAARFSVLPAAPLPSSPQPQGIKNNEGIQRLTVQLNDVQEDRIVVEIKKPGQSNKSAATYHQPLNQWKKF